MPAKIEHPSPGLPVIKGAELLDQLWTLTYIKRNAFGSTILLLPSDIEPQAAVGIAKQECKRRNVAFSWLEKTITDLREEF